MEQVAQRMDQAGVEAWFELDADELLGDECDDYEKVTDTLDVWFDSGVTHACVLRQRDELHSPADLYLEGSDQHRGWFQSSLLTGIAIDDAAPYKTVLTHGFTVDGDGRKMSKSLGNIIPAKKAMNDLGADILRLWVAATDYRGELSVSDEIFKRTADSYRRIRNTARFLLSNLDGFNPAADTLSSSDMLSLDRWAVGRAAQLQQELIEAYRCYNFHQVYQMLHNFCANDLGGFYLDVIKDRLYTTQTNSLARRSAQTAMYHISEALVRWIAPILSFTAEEIWENLPGERGPSVMLALWSDDLQQLEADESMGEAFWRQLILVRTAVNKAMEAERTAGVLRGSLDAAVTLYCSPELGDTLQALGDELRFVLITSSATLMPLSAAGSDAMSTDLADLHIQITVMEDDKCERCWHRSATVGNSKAHPALCGRCIENVDGDGERREYA